MSTLDYYIENILPDETEMEAMAEAFHKDFTEKFPWEKIHELPLEKYIFAPKGKGYDDAFCRQLKFSPLASMGNTFPSIFGLYLKEGKEYKLSKTYEKFGVDYGRTFEKIKDDIHQLISDAIEENVIAADENELDSAFKGILLATYLPEKYLPAPTHTALEAYYKTCRMYYDPKKRILSQNRKLIQKANQDSRLRCFSSFQKMRFFDWLWRENKSYTFAMEDS